MYANELDENITPYGPLVRSRSNATQESESIFTVFLLFKLKGRSRKSEPRRKCKYFGDDGDDDYDVADDAVKVHDLITLFSMISSSFSSSIIPLTPIYFYEQALGAWASWVPPPMAARKTIKRSQF